MTKKEFFKYIKTNLKADDTRFYIGRGNHLNCDGERVGGYFDADERIMAVANGPKVSETVMLETTAHEYCHFLQWREQTKAWTTAHKLVCNEDFDQILNPKIEWDNNLQKMLKATINMELECERKVIKLIDQLNLPIKKEVYIKKANSYLYFYSFLIERRKWYPNNHAPYKKKHLYVLLPSELKTNYITMPNKLLTAFRKEYQN